MAWFRKDKPVNEARDYLRATDAVSRPMAAVLSLITIVILAILFFLLLVGVRWGIEAIFGNSNDTEVTVTTPADGASPTPDTEFGGSVNDGTLSFPGFVTDEEAQRLSGGGSGANVQSGAALSNSQQVPVTGGTTTPTVLPNTGPGL